jgi:hypothetical protein
MQEIDDKENCEKKCIPNGKCKETVLSHVCLPLSYYVNKYETQVWLKFI